MTARHEYRITWRRAGWSPTTSNKSRTFERRHDAQQLVDRLAAHDRPDLAPLELLRVDRRRVSAWQPDPTLRGRQRPPGRR